jgi:hypothetical protein
MHGFGRKGSQDQQVECSLDEVVWLSHA